MLTKLATEVHYQLLWSSNRFKSGVDNHYRKLKNELTDTERGKIRDCKRKIFAQHGSFHIYQLVNKSRPAFGSERENFAKDVRKLYEKLDSDADLQAILKIVAKSDEADIVFDFKSDNVNEMDPTANTQTFGLTYPTGYILIGASRSPSDLLGTLIHELMHFALQLVYENNCLPFFESDLDKRSLLESFVEKYDNSELKSKCNIIARAFQYETIDRKIAELIVRPAQLIAMYNGKLNVPPEIREAFEDLFNYFETEAIPSISSALHFLDGQKSIRKLNLNLGFFKQYEESKIFCIKSKRSIENISGKNILIRSKTPELVAVNYVKYLVETIPKASSKYLVTDLKTLLDKKFSIYFAEVIKHDFKPTIVLVIPEKDEIDTRPLGWDILSKCGTRCDIIMIANTTDSENAFFNGNYSITYKWHDLNENSQTELLKKKFKLHERLITLNSVISDVNQIENQPLENIFKLVETNFNEELPSPVLPFYIDRRFKKTFEKKLKFLNTEKLADCVSKEHLVILADDPGMGKSTSSLKIATILKENTSDWIAYIELQKHCQKFKKDHEVPGSIDAKFFSEHILDLNSNPEMKFLFELMYRAEGNQGQRNEFRVTFIIDGFDEISPDYKKFVLVLLKAIRESGNRLLVNTRVHLCSDLEKHLDASAYKLMPLIGDDRVNLIAKCWASDNLTENDLQQKAKKMLEKIGASKKNRKKQKDFEIFFGIPQHVYMLAAQTKSSMHKIETFNYNEYDLYHGFVSEKIENCEDLKGIRAKNERRILMSVNKFEVYHKAAVEFFFGKEQTAILQFPQKPTPLSEERIFIQGIFTPGEVTGEIEFLHMSYAEFFVADYILNNMGNDNVCGLFLKTLLNEKFYNIRKFINEGLNPNCFFRKNRPVDETAIKNHLKYKVDCPGQEGSINRRLLHFSTTENHVDLLRFILDCLLCPLRKKIEILTNQFRNNRTIHRSITETGTIAFDLLFGWIEKDVNRKSWKKIIACKGRYVPPPRAGVTIKQLPEKKKNENLVTIKELAKMKKNEELVKKIDNITSKY